MFLRYMLVCFLLWIAAICDLQFIKCVCFAGSKVEARTRNASKLIREWSRTSTAQTLPSSWQLTKTKLSLKSDRPVHLTGKAWHTNVILQYLSWFLQQPNAPEVDVAMKACVVTANNLFGLLQSARDEGVHLSARDQRQALVVGRIFLEKYLETHVNFRNFPCPYRLFHIRPKYHGVQHWVERVQLVRNPVTSGCWMGEQWIKEVANLSKKCHRRTVHEAALKRYCAGQAAQRSLCALDTHGSGLQGLKAALINGASKSGP